MKLSDFNYDLPEELIAIKPLSERTDSKLLVSNGKEIWDKCFYDLPGLLNENDIIVMNDTKVIPARLEGFCMNSRLEITLLKELPSDNGSWMVLAKPAKKLILGERFIVAEDLHAEIIEKKAGGEVILKFNESGRSFLELLEKYGSMPLPPYIAKKRRSGSSDNDTYQTIYADDLKPGSVAAPTAGLHFNPELLQTIRSKKIEIVFLTLHVGGGTFLPVRNEDLSTHKMHSEYYEISEEVAMKINNAKKNGGRVIAVGTTSLRALESASSEEHILTSRTGETDIFILPGYKFKIVDALLTNFHLPRSTLFMLVSAFIGINETQKIYRHAIEKKYRFFSYGDSSFLCKSTKL